MSTTNINIRVDSEIKQQAETIFNELGINMSTALNLPRLKSQDSVVNNRVHPSYP